MTTNFNRNILRVVLASILFFAAQFLQAQSSNLIVDKMNFSIEGPQQVAKEAVLAHIKLRVGMPFDQNSLDQSIKSLYETDLYDSVEITRVLTPAGKLNLNIVIRPKYKVAQIVFRGNVIYSAARLQEQILTYAGGVLDERKIKRDSDKIEEYYRKKGYAFTKVKFSIERNHETGVGVAIFDVNEGQDIKIQNIIFEGNDHIEADALTDQMKTCTWWWLISYLLEYGRFKEEDFQKDIIALKQYYRNHGYLDVKIDDSKIRFDFPDADNPGYMDIVIPVEEGRQYKTGKVEIRNNKLFDSADIMNKTLDIYEDDVFSPALVESTSENIKNFYGQRGYLDTVVRALRRPNLDTGKIDLMFEVIEGDKFYLESINIQGNVKTKSEVIIRELALQPGDVFSLVKMKASESRLKGTRFFSEVNLKDESINIPGRRDLRVIVKEAGTGNIVFGAGFSTVESFVVTAELTQSNFDITNWDHRFEGAGQKFRVRGSLGLKASQILIGFANPWIFNRQLEYGFELYRTDTGYYSDYYSELRTGMIHYLRKYLFSLYDAPLEGRLGYTLEYVDIYDLESDAPSFIKDEEGGRSVSKLSLSFLRDDRDDSMMPTSGTRFEFLQQLAGGPLLGQTNTYKIELRAGWWVPMSYHFGEWDFFKYGNQVFSIVGRTGSITGYDGKDVPYFERYFLGGPYNMRGYKYRKVGRRDPATDEPYGGNTSGYLSFEYSWAIIEQFRIALFYDVGFLNDKSWDFNPSDYYDDFGIGFRIMIMGAPMRIDIATPLSTRDDNSGVEFNFSFGTVF